MRSEWPTPVMTSMVRALASTARIVPLSSRDSRVAVVFGGVVDDVGRVPKQTTRTAREASSTILRFRFMGSSPDLRTRRAGARFRASCRMQAGGLQDARPYDR